MDSKHSNCIVNKKKSFNLIKRDDFLSDKYKTNKRLNISEIPEMIRLFCNFADKTHTVWRKQSFYSP